MLDERDRITEIDKKADSVSIPPKTRHINNFACFYGALTSLNIENTQIITIGKYAFSHCYELKKVQFPSSLEEICEGAFKKCMSLEQICFSVGSKLRIIGPRAFENCDELRPFIISPTIEIIGDYAFWNCDNLTQNVIELQNTNIRKIGECAYGWNEACFILPHTVDVRSVIDNIDCYINIDEDHPLIKLDECGYYVTIRTILKCISQRRHVLIRHGFEIIADSCFFTLKIVSITIPASVAEIGEYAFSGCAKLRWVHFAKDSRLKELKKKVFDHCKSLTQFRFPKSLKIIRNSFYCCKNLTKVIFPADSELERIENAFEFTYIEHLVLPKSVREIESVQNDMIHLKSIHINNEFFASNKEGTVVLSKDGSELVCVLHMEKRFEIPDGIRVIKKGALQDNRFHKVLLIPASVEVIEDGAFPSYMSYDAVEFAEGSRLKTLGFKALPNTRSLVLNNENFATMKNGVVMSMNPRGIVFVPNSLTELEIDPDIEVIYSYAFYQSNIKTLSFPKSLKKICKRAFENSTKLKSVTFEEGTELDSISKEAFKGVEFKKFKFPMVKGKISKSIDLKCHEIELPPNFSPSPKNRLFLQSCCLMSVTCPKSSINAIVDMDLSPEDLEFIDG